jgi:hypothetical protein
MIELEPRAAAHLSPRALPRIGGALYLTIIAIGAFGEMGSGAGSSSRKWMRARAGALRNG